MVLTKMGSGPRNSAWPRAAWIVFLLWAAMPAGAPAQTTVALYGQVTLWDGTAVGGVTMTLSGSESGVTTTDRSGNYSFSVSPGANYPLTPSLTGDTFSPASGTFNNLTADQYVSFAALPPVTISGQVTRSGTGLGGVTMTLSGPQSSTTTTDASGNYSFSGLPNPNDPNISYKVTPSLSGDSFSPPFQTADIYGGVSSATENFAVALGGAATFHLLATFQGANNGRFPSAPLVLATDGNFYGTTGEGGTDDHGTIFRMTPSGTLTTLYSFLSTTDGAGPNGLMQAADGNFYGTTNGSYAATVIGNGTVFQMTPAGAVTTLHTFAGNDGSHPLATLVQGADGNLYGTTFDGTGAVAGGTIFSITPTVPAQLTTMYTFCSAPQCSDGSGSSSQLVKGTDGNFYGVTGADGANKAGTVFSITPTVPPTFTTLCTFNRQPPYVLFPGITSADNTLVQGADGNFYGSSSGIFRITPQGVLTILYTLNPGTDGGGPSGLVQDQAGKFYGTANVGGANGDGTVFEVSLSFTISGLVTDVVGNPLGGVTVTLSGSQSATTSTDNSGKYTFTEPGGGNYTVTPSLSAGAFSPASQTFNNLSANQTQNFTASATTGGTFTISGQVTDAGGNPLSGVTGALSGSQSATATTDSSGNYTFTEQAGGSYTITPSLSGDTFTPAGQTFNNLSGNQTQNFTASATTGGTFTISGQVTLRGRVSAASP